MARYVSDQEKVLMWNFSYSLAEIIKEKYYVENNINLSTDNLCNETLREAIWNVQKNHKDLLQSNRWNESST